MIKNNGYTTFLMSSILAITLLSVSLTTIQPAFAHEDPNNCSINGGDTDVTVLKNGLSIGSTVIQGQVLELKITIDKGGGVDHCAVDGGNGEETGLGTDITLPDGTFSHEDFGCIGGTANGGDQIGPADCAGSPTEVVIDDIFYTVDCSDVQEVTTGVFRLVWNQATNALYHDFAGDVGPSELNKEDNIQKACVVPEYSANTTSSDTGVIDGTVSDPTDTVHIYGVNGVEGNWTTDAILAGPSGDFDATCVTSPLVTNGTFPVDVVCSLDAAPIDLTEPGTYCWDVTIEETSGVYGTTGDGELLGSDDEANECFTIPEDYTVTTLSNVTGTNPPPVNSPTDTVTITGENGVEGTFEVTAELTGPGGPYAATCADFPLVTDSFPADVLCELDAAPIDLTEPGEYCWDVTVTETTDAYGSASDGTFLGSDDSQNECFTIAENTEGLTPGFWKANAAQWNANQWAIEDPEDSFNSVFGTSVELKLPKNDKSGISLGDSNDPTLYGALNALGGGDNALARHCVAAKLNAEHPLVDYPWDAATVIDTCGTTLNGTNLDWTVESLKNQLDTWNNLGADINQHGPY